MNLRSVRALSVDRRMRRETTWGVLFDLHQWRGRVVRASGRGMRQWVMALGIGAGLLAAQAPARDYSAMGRALVEQMAVGQFAKVEGRYTSQLAAKLPAGRLAEVWNRTLVAQEGALESITAVRTVDARGVHNVIVTCKFARSSLNLIFALGADGRMAGLHIAPVVQPGAAPKPKTMQTLLQPASNRRPAPAFTATDAKGRMIRLAGLKGRVVVLDFWATWCAGCKEELPVFSALQTTYGPQGLVVVGASVDTGWNVVRPFLAKIKPDYRMVLADAARQKAYGIGNMPNTFLIDRHGRIAATYRAGLVDPHDLEAHIQAVLNER